MSKERDGDDQPTRHLKARAEGEPAQKTRPSETELGNAEVGETLVRDSHGGEFQQLRGDSSSPDNVLPSGDPDDQLPTENLSTRQPQKTPPEPTPGGKTDPILRVGQFGKYQIVSKIGAGGFGKVYLGRDPLLGRDVAVKTCTSDDERLRRRFLHEAKIAAGLQHPNIVTVHDFGYEGETPFMVQEYLSGEDLTHKIANRDLPLELRIEYLMSIASGLAHAHDNNVLHRDIKPANIRVCEDGQVRVLDFGIARMLDQTTAFTTDGVAMGTVGYLAPELLNSDEIDERSDIFSFGVLAYELIGYQRPFLGDTFLRVSFRLLHEDPPPLADLAPECPPALLEIIEQCLEKSPGDRYPSFHEVMAALARLIEDSQATSVPLPAFNSGSRPIPVPPTSAPTTTPAPRPRSEQTSSPPAPKPTPAALQPEMPTAPTIQVKDLRRQAQWQRLRPWLFGALVAAALSLGLWLFRGSQSPIPEAEGAPNPSPSSILEAGPIDHDPIDQDRAPSARVETESKPVAGKENGSVDRATSPPITSETAKQPASPPPSSTAELAAEPIDSPKPKISEPIAKDQRPVDDPRSTQSPGAQPVSPEPEGESQPAASTASPSLLPPVSSAPTTVAESDSAATEVAAEPVARPAAESQEGTTETAESAAAAAAESALSQISSPPIKKVLPRLIDRVQPQYPPRARRRRLEATVTLGVRVDTDGSVVQTLVQSSTLRNEGFEQAAEQAARRSRFEPGTEDDQPVAMWTKMVFQFKRSN